MACVVKQKHLATSVHVFSLSHPESEEVGAALTSNTVFQATGVDAYAQSEGNNYCERVENFRLPFLSVEIPVYKLRSFLLRERIKPIR